MTASATTNGMLEMQKTTAVRATAQVPCFGKFPPARLADLTAVARYFKVGIVVQIMTKIGAMIKTTQKSHLPLLSVSSTCNEKYRAATSHVPHPRVKIWKCQSPVQNSMGRWPATTKLPQRSTCGAAAID